MFYCSRWSIVLPTLANSCHCWLFDHYLEKCYNFTILLKYFPGKYNIIISCYLTRYFKIIVGKSLSSQSQQWQSFTNGGSILSFNVDFTHKGAATQKNSPKIHGCRELVGSAQRFISTMWKKNNLNAETFLFYALHPIYIFL